ncbi:MAG TPA: hypothetical protein VF189_02275, partial [Patescibacteria group bacterium]
MMSNEMVEMFGVTDAMQRASEFGDHGHMPKTPSEPKPGERFRQAREKHAAMSEDQHAARRFGRNPKGY